MRIPGLTASAIRDRAAQGSFERGREYADSGAVVSLRRTAPGVVEGRVKGSRPIPYAVRIRHREEGIADVECSCPYFAGAWCKHIVAVLLTYMEGDYDVDRHEILTATIKDLEREELVALIESLANAHPETVTWFAEHLKDRMIE